MPDGRVLIAPGDGPLTADPEWIRIDEVTIDGETPAVSLVKQIEIRTGRQTEFDLTETGTATVWCNDTEAWLHPNGGWWGFLEGKQILLQLYDPVTETWFERFRGIIDGQTNDQHPSGLLSNVQLQCVDMFDYLSQMELLPGVHGSPPPVGSESEVFYEDGEVDTRILQLLTTDAGLDPDRVVVFSGNVNLIETLYDAGDPVLIAIRDAADGEFPGLANVYVDRKGRVVFHGRGAKLDPDGVSAGAGDTAWDFQRFPMGDGPAIVLDSDRGQIRPPLQIVRSRSRIVNAALCWPRGVPREDIAAMVRTDPTSMAAYGVRTWSYDDSICGGHKTNGNTGPEECELVSEFYVANYSEPRARVEQMTALAIRPDDPRAAPTWKFLTRCDISDVVELSVTHTPNGGIAVDEDFFVEGWTQEITPLHPGHDMVALTANLSPKAYYLEDVWPDG